MRKLFVAESAGFCFGVERSIRMAEEQLERGGCYCLGELIHNSAVVGELSARGLQCIESVDELPQGAPVVLRSHGIGESVYRALEEKAAQIVDATCPRVAAIHRIVRKASEEGRTVLIVGTAEHPEVQGIRGWCQRSFVVKTLAETERLFREEASLCAEPLTVVFQTTEIREKHVQIVNFLKKLYTKPKIFDTICAATSTRQREARTLAEKCDAMVIVGDRSSANSRHLYELCAEKCPRVDFVSGAEELECSRWSDCDTVGISAGASVPSWIIKEVVNKMCDEIKINPEEMTEEKPEAEKSFDELLEDSIRTIYNGDTVTGYVVGITATEVIVDLGTKHSGYIATEEFTEDGTKIEDAVHVGDQIEACVVRVNDVEGTVALSKRRLDSIRSWSDVENAAADGTVLEGKVTEDNKGGVVVNIRGIRVFVPASQTDLPREAAMSELLGKTVRLKITEVNRGRKRVVGSIRAVTAKERKERAEQIWNEIEVGKHYEGTVKSMTNFGAFVDIGGVDGMVHVSEISWNRINKPSDVLNIGDKIDVYVIKLDTEKHKISLGHRDPEMNPWKRFTDTYAIGDVAKVTVVKLMPFGAFAEVLPGVDGLIHISQIANRRIAQPGEVLTVGDVVDAKITNIDFEKQKISLSIRALSEPAPAPAREEKEEEELAPEEDALVYEVGADGSATGVAPEMDEE
ncbi:MAG: bifunctional 4-hydroxy-3-methylbut-2-enyl diphosphate reductase/30S ribosomal protein S1 [Clostridiales bacterium]|nr:bifunctional 4-hydroxy-3-methylbut-2-enyl diphosphate reductase/30S ribosomal protein S1 [Candidatus Apopatocola equi]